MRVSNAAITTRCIRSFRTRGRACATVSTCGGGLVALRPRVLPRLNTFMDALGNARKSPWRLAGLFGWDVLARFAIGRLAIEHAEARASRLMSARVGAIRSSQPQIALNVDRVEDVARANARFRGPDVN